uniref:ANK_REP_REGION domain-containing protein n=1 Tax=Syphacia muris TaxID=451379 RepID=A0A0N5AGD9_9BILA
MKVGKQKRTVDDGTNDSKYDEYVNESGAELADEIIWISNGQLNPSTGRNRRITALCYWLKDAVDTGHLKAVEAMLLYQASN